MRVVPKATNTAPDLHNTKTVTPAGPRDGSGGAARRTTEHSGAQQKQDWAQSRVGGAYGSGHRELAFARRVGGASGGLRHSRRLSRAVGGVSLSRKGSRRLGAQHAGAGARWARPRELLTASWGPEPVAARGAGERGRRCWQLRRALPARLGRAGSEMPGAQASIGRHQAAVGSGQEAPERTGAGRPPAAEDPPVPRRSVRDEIRSSLA